MSENNNRRRNRALSEDERTLWKRVTETLTPLEKKRCKLVRVAIKDDPIPPAPIAAAPKPVKNKPAPTRPPARPARPTPPAAPPLAPLDRRMLQQLARGKVSIDGKIDLHGMTQAEAYGRLHSYLAGAQARGRKVILVITGKGGDGYGGEGRGILRRMVPMWLQMPEYRPIVTGFEEAHGSHGGAGALYVRIRRNKGISAR